MIRVNVADTSRTASWDNSKYSEHTRKKLPCYMKEAFSMKRYTSWPMNKHGDSNLVVLTASANVGSYAYVVWGEDRRKQLRIVWNNSIGRQTPASSIDYYHTFRMIHKYGRLRLPRLISIRLLRSRMLQLAIHDIVPTQESHQHKMLFIRETLCFWSKHDNGNLFHKE